MVGRTKLKVIVCFVKGRKGLFLLLQSVTMQSHFIEQEITFSSSFFPLMLTIFSISVGYVNNVLEW